MRKRNNKRSYKKHLSHTLDRRTLYRNGEPGRLEKCDLLVSVQKGNINVYPVQQLISIFGSVNNLCLTRLQCCRDQDRLVHSGFILVYL